MAGNKIARKIRFLSYFPYGFCSRLATTIEGKDNPYATQFLLGEDPDETIANCEQYRKNILDKARYLCETGCAKDKKLSCGTPAEKRSFRFVTKRGVVAFMETPDDICAEEIDAETQDMAYDGNKKGSHFYSTTEAAEAFRDALYEYATERDAQSQNFTRFLLNAVMDGNITPLSYAVDIAGQTTINTSKYSQNQIYTIWRLSHVNAMFMVNGFLTYLDRRPHNTGFAIDGITDHDSYLAYLEQHGQTVASLSYYALTNWYRENPGYYQITQRYPDTSAEAKEAWLNTPAFYAAKELPGTETTKTSYEREDVAGSQRKYRSSHIGLAMGKKVNYACYHGKTGIFKWTKRKEENTKAEIETAVRRMKTQNPEMRNKDTVDFGLYFCSSYHQFLALFRRTKEKHEKDQKQNYPTSAPYTSLHAVPVNDSGAFLLWCLMVYSPMEAEERIRNILVEKGIGFSHSTNRYYPMTYHGKRVFAGYTMDIEKINYALEDYLDGGDFYICCFPDQATWYRKLFPGKAIL